MSAEVFVDTSVFVYHVDGSDARKQCIAERLVRDALGRGAPAPAPRSCRSG